MQLNNILDERKHSLESKTSINTTDRIDDEELDDRMSPDDFAALSLEALKSRIARRRDSAGTGRRNSEGGGGGANCKFLLSFFFCKRKLLIINSTNQLKGFVKKQMSLEEIKFISLLFCKFQRFFINIMFTDLSVLT